MTAWNKRKFRYIDTTAIGPLGCPVHCRRSYPNGADYAEYQRVDAALVRAFGVQGSRTEGTFLDSVVTTTT